MNKKRIGVILTLCIVMLFSFLIYEGISASNKYNYGEIKALKIGGFFPQKEIKSKRDINKILSLIDNVKIVKSYVEPRRGIGITVDIVYPDSNDIESESFSFLGNTMAYYAVDKHGRILNKNDGDSVDITGRGYERYKNYRKYFYFKPAAVWYKINTNILDDLRKIYEDN